MARKTYFLTDPRVYLFFVQPLPFSIFYQAIYISSFILFYFLNRFFLYISFFPAFSIVFLPKRQKQHQVSHIRSQLLVVVA